MAAPKSRIPLVIGLTAAGGVGYYLYSAGGNPKVAEKQFEKDVSAASAKVKSELPGRGKEAQKEGEKWAQEAGAKIDSASDSARAELAKANQYRKDLGKDTQKKIDEIDNKVEKKTSEAKSGISSWFGGK
ncbi:hypothetical protein B7494_g186 [Chlorociboria aeruginascens]|nr:hypothetical protein B7494_g186 [Chlorociboria aeruginascens]